jgi:hypothetical protein
MSQMNMMKGRSLKNWGAIFVVIGLDLELECSCS